MLSVPLNLRLSLSRHAEEDDINAPPPQIQAAIKNNDIGNLLDLDWDEPSAETPVSPILQSNAPGNTFNDLLSLGGGGGDGSSSSQAAVAAPASNNMDDIMNLFNSPASPPPPQQQQQYQSPMMNDFTSDLFGDSTPQPAQPTTTNTATQAPKDPFADLF